VTPHLKNWRKIITEASKLNRRDKLTAVNDFFNRWPYKEDRELYGLNEYWATPREFMTRSGDCEDFAIAKYYALRELGFAEEDMRVVILMDEIRGIGHAVLAVYRDDDILILDSLSNLILPHERYKHYVPQYSMNETTRWAHIGGFEKRKTPAYQGLAARN
jgi:predicted transglutaminase-like cysteine proteinase